jgi:hypothetical protein
MKKSNVKGEISGYREFVAIKRELRKNILKQEESFNNDILSIDNIYNTTMTFLTRKKKKEKVFDNSNTLMLSDLIVQFVEPYIKDKRKKQVVLPAISLGISFFVTNLLNNGFQKNQST